jgi:hypothetical protein
MSEDVQVVTTTSTDGLEIPPTTTTDTPAFSATYDRDSLITNAPEGVDREAFGKYLDKTSDAYAGFKSYSNIEKMKSKGLPNASWTDEDHKALDGARGVPDTVEGYAFSEETTLDDVSAQFVRDTAFANRLTPKQAQGLADTLTQVRALEEASNQKLWDEGNENMEKFLHSEWGHKDTQAHANNRKLVEGVLEGMYDIAPDSEEAKEVWSGNPKMVKMLHDIGTMQEPGVIASFGAGDTTTSGSIQDQMDAISIELNKSEIGSKPYNELNSKWDSLHSKLSRIESSPVR